MNYYNYEQALSACVQYFNGDDLAASVFLSKYALKDNQGNLLEKTPEMMHRRIAKEFARIESKKFKQPLTENFIFDLLDRFRYIVPQGGPMFGIGNNYQTISLSSCYLLESPLDSYNSIIDVDKQLVNISKRRGGVGIDLSNLRPNASLTTNSARASTGTTTWMERYSNSIREVGQNNRRGALMLTLDVHHPDIFEFCTVKNDESKVTGANISVRLSKEFLDAVNKEGEVELRFPVDYKKRGIKPLISKMVKARELWNTIIDSAWKRAEPGLLMWDNVTKNTPADCYEEYNSQGTNPCSEINLHPLDSCRLLCLNLFSYVDKPFTKEAKFNFSIFKYHARIAQRLMDDLVDLESEKINAIIKKIDSDPEPESVKRDEREMWQKIKKLNDEGRRTGTGITALGDTLAALGIKYGTDKAVKITEDIYRELKLACYDSSVMMAVELGPFKGYDPEKEMDCPFVQRIAEEFPILYYYMVKYGRRNVALLTTAPTGTVSLETQTSSGIEPLFQMSYIRRRKINPFDTNTRVDFIDKTGDKWQEYNVYHPKIRVWMEATGEKDVTKSPWFGSCAEDIDWVKRVEMQAAAQKHVCHSISSTINLPEDVSREKVAEIYQKAFQSGCKGITIYRKNCRSGVLIDKKEEKQTVKIIHTNAPKRPEVLPGEIFAVNYKKEKLFVALGFYHKDPYEVFVGKNFRNKIESARGNIVKKSRGQYVFVPEDGEEIHLNNGYSNDEADAMTRLISSNLRHGCDISYVAHQLEKTKGDLTSFGKVLARVLKKQIKDGTHISGEECPECEGKLIRENGCIHCSCGYSKCL